MRNGFFSIKLLWDLLRIPCWSPERYLFRLGETDHSMTSLRSFLWKRYVKIQPFAGTLPLSIMQSPSPHGLSTSVLSVRISLSFFLPLKTFPSHINTCGNKKRSSLVGFHLASIFCRVLTAIVARLGTDVNGAWKTSVSHKYSPASVLVSLNSYHCVLVFWSGH